jgi:hypothetical protein
VEEKRSKRPQAQGQAVQLPDVAARGRNTNTLSTTQERTDRTCACREDPVGTLDGGQAVVQVALGFALLTSIKSSEGQCKANEKAGGEKRSRQRC